MEKYSHVQKARAAPQKARTPTLPEGTQRGLVLLEWEEGCVCVKKTTQTAYMKFLKMVFWSSFISTIHLHVLNKILYFSLGLQDTVR